MLRTVILVLALCFNSYCKSPASSSTAETQNSAQENIQAAPGLMLGAEQLDILLPLLQNKRVALLVNHTATIGDTHLVDTLLRRGVNIKKIFGPEHGFRGNAADGEVVSAVDASIR